MRGLLKSCADRGYIAEMPVVKDPPARSTGTTAYKKVRVDLTDSKLADLNDVAEMLTLRNHTASEGGGIGRRAGFRFRTPIATIPENAGNSSPPTGSEGVTKGPLGTHSGHGNQLSPEEMLHKIRVALDAGVITEDYAQTLTELVDVLLATQLLLEDSTR